MTKEDWLLWLLVVVKVLIFIYDVITWPIYYFIQKPWLKIEAQEKLRARSIRNNPGGPYRNIKSFSPVKTTISEDINSLYELFKQTSIQFEEQVCLGTRELLEEEEETQPDGKVFKKLILGDYRWLSYNATLTQIKNFARGVRSVLGTVTKETKVVIFAETRAEWIIAALACFRYNITVVTLYATLGDEALVHGINETKVELIITSQELLPKFKKILCKIPSVKHLIYMEGFSKPSFDGYSSDTKLYSFRAIEKMGSDSSEKFTGRIPSARENIAIIMYTSGSTGVPKGVMISHFNILSMIASYSSILPINDSDVYLAYLPLAHVLETAIEFLCLSNGVPIGYSSPQTLVDMSPKIKRGSQGDATVLRPTIMACVPLILDRMYKNVIAKVSSDEVQKQFFNFAVSYKANAMQSGYSTPILDFIVFRSIKNLLGGRMRLMITGGAPVSADIQDFIRLCMSCPLLQAYGLTETCGGSTIMDADDLSNGRVGSPSTVNDIELVDWEEGNYRTTDKPYPRGEILIGGPNVTLGYYENPEKTAEDYFEKNGKRWFRSGDIGEIHPDGCMKIIDRKKDLVKLQGGEYVSLGKVESELKLIGVVENICVYGDSFKTYTVALITPNAKELEKLGAKLGKEGKDFKELCNDKDVEKAVEKLIMEQGKRSNLPRFEIPSRVKLIPDIWLPDSGLVTAAYKLKRKPIQDHYKNEIDSMYGTK